MRILMTAEPGGGSWNFALDLAAGLGEQGVEVVLATLGTRPLPAQRREARAIETLALVESDLHIPWTPEALGDVDAAGAWLMELARQYQVDVVHCNHLTHAALPWDVPVLVVGHQCVLTRWEAVHGVPTPPEWEGYREQVGSGLRAANAVIAPSDAMRQSMQQHYGPLVDVAVIRNARRPVLQSSVRKEPFVFSLGRVFDSGKNLAVLGQVASVVEWPIRIAGATRDPDGNVVDVPGVSLLGELSSRAVAAWLRRAAIFTLPARYEPFGLSALDAARAGCALVLGDIPSLRESWDGAALFVPPDDPEAIAGAITRLIASPEERASFSRLARQRAGRFSYETFVREYLLAYRVLRGGYERLYDGVREIPHTPPLVAARVGPAA